MASSELQLISAVIRNGDPHTIIGEDKTLFGSTSDVISFIQDYYKSYKAVPSEEILKKEFKDIDLPDTQGPSTYFLDKVKSEFIKSHMAFFMDNAQQALDAGDAPIHVFEKIMGKLGTMAKFTSSSHDVNMTNYEEAIGFLELEKEKAGDKLVPGIPTGFDSIDINYPTGFAGGHSIVFLGFSGKGKSFFSALIGVKAWAAGHKVMVVSLEMNPSEYRNRLYPMMSHGRFTISEMGNASVDTEEVKRWGEEELKGSSDFIVIGVDNAGDMTPNKIQAKIDQYQPDIVIIDYLQLMMDNQRSEGMTPRMLGLSREIKLMAMRNDIPIISITAVTDDENSKREHAPTLKQIAWSRGIEYDANLAIAVHRYPGTNYVHIVCRKNRIGDEFSFFFEVDFDRGIWNEIFDIPETLKEHYA